MKPNGIEIIKKRVEKNRKKAMELFRQNFSYRQIQEILGYKSVGSVQHLLGKRKKVGVVKKEK